VAEIFGRRYRAAHEPGYEQLIEMIFDAARGAADQARLGEFITARDGRLRLELECSHPLFHLLDALLAAFDDAKFILTIRDCYSWLDSQMNNQLAYIEGRHWRSFGEFKYRGETARHPKEEEILSRFGLYTLDGYLAAWASHNNKVLNTVPRERLLVIRTQDIAKDMTAIADFLGVPPSHLDSARAYSFKGEKKFHLLSKLDEQYLEEKVNMYCRPLMDRYFPEVENFKVWHSARRRA
jgi:Sulfotransferase domain